MKTGKLFMPILLLAAPILSLAIEEPEYELLEERDAYERARSLIKSPSSLNSSARPLPLRQARPIVR